MSEAVELTEEELEAQAFESGYSGEEVEAVVSDEPDDEPEVEESDDEPGEEEVEASAEEEQPKPDPVVPDLSKLESRLRNMEGKFGSLNAAMQRMAAAAEQANKAGAEAPNAAEAREALQDSAKMKALKEEFPEWAEAMEEQIGAAKSSILKELPTKDALREEIRREILEEMRMEMVEDAHEGWRDTVQTPEFAVWMKSQGDDIRALAQSDRPRDAIKLLDRFVADTNNSGNESANAEPPANNSRKRLQSAVPATRPGSTNRRERTTSEEEAFIRAFNGG